MPPITKPMIANASVSWFCPGTPWPPRAFSFRAAILKSREDASWLFRRSLDTSAPMRGFVVKATAGNGELTWIAPSFGGLPVLGSRASADVFSTRVDAYAAIDLMPYQLNNMVRFSIEPAKWTGPILRPFQTVPRPP
jgi:hypothetical protein